MRGARIIIKNMQEKNESESAQRMGVIQRYFTDIRMGTVKTETMDAYSFNGDDWTGTSGDPVAGQRVTFDVVRGRATNIRPDSKP